MTIYTFNLDGPIVPKARARVTANGTFHPSQYSDWKEQAISSLRSQYRGEPIQRFALSFLLKGKHSRRGDGDNVEGSILDALVQAGVAKDDNLLCNPSAARDLEWSKEAPTTVIYVKDLEA